MCKFTYSTRISKHIQRTGPCLQRASRAEGRSDRWKVSIEERWRNFAHQFNTTSKHPSKLTKAWLLQKKMKVLKWPSQKPRRESKCTSVRWSEEAVHRWCSGKLTVLECFCKEEWTDIAKSRCAMLTDSYPKWQSAWKKSKGALIMYQWRGLHMYAKKKKKFIIFIFPPKKNCFWNWIFRIIDEKK